MSEVIFHQAVVDCFTYLGLDAAYKVKHTNEVFLIKVLIRQPDAMYEMGEGSLTVEVAHFEVLMEDIPLCHRGDQLQVGGTLYTVQSEPLLDSKRLTWKIQAVVL